MKANSCGTFTEQQRHRAGWLTPAERKAQSVQGKCGDCAGIDQNHGAHCKKHKFSTKAVSVCSSFELRTAEVI